MSEVRELNPVTHVYPSGAVVVANYRAFVQLDNYDPPRKQEVVMLEEIQWPPAEDGFTGVEMEVIRGLDVFPYGAKALWIIDDGSTTRLMYTATYHPELRNIGLKSFPTGLPSGPTVTYHLKITAV
jgi:hypothetical protein